MKNIPRKKLPKIELLNFEGPVLVAHKSRNIFVITDEWKEVIDIFYGIEEMEDFLNGEFSVTDTKGRNWMYTKENGDAKPTKEKIDQFIKD
jgi:hypothetical protein